MLPIHSYNDDDLYFHEIEKHAKKAKPTDAKTYDKLIEYLQSPLDKNEPNREILLARAILVWICQLLPKAMSGDHSAPGGLIKQMKEGRVEYSRVFKIFCGYADIECEVVTGRAKAIRYMAGDDDSSYIQGHTWNAFKSGNQWHLLHPQWCIHSYVGFEQGGEYRLVDDGKQAVKQLERRDGVSMWRLNAFWFCTNPEIFVQRCLPDDQAWQFLPGDKIVSSVEMFMSLPDLRQGFYSHYLRLLTEKACSIKANNGTSSVTFMADKNCGKELMFSYELLAANVDKLDVKSLPMLVLYTPNQPKDTFTFELSLPAPGNYRLKIRIGTKGQQFPLINCCETKIVCTNAAPGCKRLPIDTGIQGWGTGPEAIEAGLKQPSTSGAKIPVNKKGQQKGQALFSAKLDADAAEDTSFTAEIHRPDNGGTENAIVKVDKQKRKVTIHAPNDKPLQDAALTILAMNKNAAVSNQQPVANYILQSSDEYVDTKGQQTKLNKTYKDARNQMKMDEKLKKKGLLEDEKERRKRDMDKLLKTMIK